MVLGVLLAAALSQGTVYVWTDRDGTEHYTDDLASIPKGVKVRTTDGQPVERLGTAPAARPAAQPAPEAPDRCRPAREAVSRAEATLARVRATPTRVTLTCQQVLNLRGQDAYGRCMGGEPPPATEGPPSPAAVKQAEAELERARDELRKVTYAGCR